MYKVKKKLMKVSALNIFEDNDEFSYKNLYGCARKISASGTLGWRPQTDVYETESELVVLMDISYINPQEIEVEIDETTLFIRGVRIDHDREEKRHYYKMEIDFGPFESVITLPFKADKKQTSVSYHDGFFVVRIKKNN